MNTYVLATLCGLVFGVIDVLIMIPLKYDNRRKRIEAMGSAFIDRFLIGFLIPFIDLGISPILTGFLIGFFLSLPSAIITRAYVPILGIGAVGGLVIGLIVR